MTPVAPPLFPGSRTVAAWWRELSTRNPRRWWLCHLLLHRVEALVETSVRISLDALTLGVLRSLAAGQPPAGLDAGLFSRLIRELTTAGLLSANPDCPRPTEAGERALDKGFFTSPTRRRWTFCFIDNRELRRDPHFVPLTVSGVPVIPPDDWEFNIDHLRSAAGQTEQWKKSFGFPNDCTRILLPASQDPDWQSVVLDRAEHLFAAFLEIDNRSTAHRLLGFAANPAGWTLRANEPVIALGDAWSEALPDLAIEPRPEAWQVAWQQWGTQRGLPPAEVSSCRLERSGLALRVEVSRRLIARLREARSDALKGDTWLLAGSGRARCIARVELLEAKA
jgi:hypothetical protein